MNNKYPFLKEVVQQELESSGTCNLNCQYCYIPKDIKIQSKVNRKIIDQISSGKYIKLLKKIYGDKLEQLSLWGTEPTLNLSVFLKSNFFDKLLNEFKKLKSISFSTNLYNNSKKIIDLYEHLNELQNKYDRNLNLSIQFSVDGHEKITDFNRGIGLTSEIIKTLKDLQEYHNSTKFEKINKLTIEHHFKPTIDSLNIKWFIENPDEFKQYIDFFDEINNIFNESLEKQHVKKHIRFIKEITPTLQLPGEYTSIDGKNFQEFIRLIKSKFIPYVIENKKNVNLTIPYKYRLINVFRNYNSFNTSISRGNSLFTCSQGDTMLGISQDGHVSPCHHFFFLYDKDFRELWMNMKNYNLKNKDIEPIVDQMFIDSDDVELFTKMIYSIRGYHDWLRPQVDNQQLTIIELRKFGFLSDEMIDISKEYIYLFQLFIISQFSCPMMNIQLTGSLNTIPISLYNIFGNGQFYEILKDLIEDGDRN